VADTYFVSMCVCVCMRILSMSLRVCECVYMCTYVCVCVFTDGYVPCKSVLYLTLKQSVLRISKKKKTPLLCGGVEVKRLGQKL